MAYFVRKADRTGEPRYIFIYVHKAGKNVPLPRARTRHLDGQPDHNIRAWIAQHVDVRRASDNAILWSDDALRDYLDKFKTHLKQEGKSRVTITQHISLLERYAIPYFLGLDRPLKDPNHWPSYSLQMRDWLMVLGLSGALIFRVNVALRKFFEWLKEERYVLPELNIALRKPIFAPGVTPLQYTATPDDTMDFVKGATPTIKLLTLIGYFFSLRPQEVLALRKEDFKAGSKVLELDCSKAMTDSGLFDKLVVNIARQRNGYNQIGPLKTKASKGWVSCFDERAARALVALLKELPEGELFPEYHSRHYFTLWRRDGFEGLSLKDLRRASLYWLGHFSKLSPVHLMKHARHARIETTMLYLRRPDEDLAAEDTLDLDL